MFKKEAHEFQKQIQQEYLDLGKNGAYPPLWERIGELWQKGAEFGYNKANEWHYPSKGELPKDLCLVIACFWELGKKQVREVYFDSKYFCYHGKHIEPVAWQYYPVPPKEDK